MAYGRKTKSTRTRGRTRYSTKRRAAPKRRKTASKRRTAAKRSSGHQKITLVIQQAPATPTLATPGAKAPPVRAKFGG